MSDRKASRTGVEATGEFLEWQLDRFRGAKPEPALIWQDRVFPYGELLAGVERWQSVLADASVAPGSSVAVVGDFSPASVSCLLALSNLKCILVPLSRASKDQHGEFCKIAEVDWLIDIDADDQPKIEAASQRRHHALFTRLRREENAGLVLFTSGSTGGPRAVVHRLSQLLEKFRIERHRFRTIGFLLFDHIGGVNTLFYTLANLGCLVVPADRSVAAICAAIEKHKVELLPTSPSFLNFLLMAGPPGSYDLSSLRVITYGTEVMLQTTLRRARETFPQVKFQQTYGLTELGILRSKSAADDSVLVKVGGEGYETKVVDGTLRVRATSSMLGYLNAPSPFDDEGWFDTGDAVIEQDGYYRILGRQSDIINVGGQKVFPGEIEKVIAELPGVIDASVRGEAHALLGQIVVATVQMVDPIPATDMKNRITEHSRGRLQPFMIPTKVRVVTTPQVNYRFKRVRQ